MSLLRALIVLLVALAASSAHATVNTTQIRRRADSVQRSNTKGKRGMMRDLSLA